MLVTHDSWSPLILVRLSCKISRVSHPWGILNDVGEVCTCNTIDLLYSIYISKLQKTAMSVWNWFSAPVSIFVHSFKKLYYSIGHGHWLWSTSTEMVGKQVRKTILNMLSIATLMTCLCWAKSKLGLLRLGSCCTGSNSIPGCKLIWCCAQRPTSQYRLCLVFW